MIQEVNANHPAIAAEREQLGAVKQGVYQAYAGFLPSASARYDHGKQRVQYNNLAHISQDTTGKGVTVSQPLFNGGGTFAQVGAARARMEGSEARFKQVQQQVLLSAIAAYVDVVEKQAVYTIAKENAEALEQHLHATRTQFEAGELTITDISQSEARLARAQAELHDAEAAVSNAREAYVRETGKQPEATEFPPLPTVLPNSQDEVIAKIAVHPAVIEATQNEEVADYTINERVADILPSVRLEGAINDNKGYSQPNVNASDERTAMVRVSIPLFQSGAEYARISEARYQYARSRNVTTDTRRETQNIALREWNNFIAARAAIIQHQHAVDAGEKALDSVQKERLAGTRTVLDVLNERDEMYTARVNLIRAESRKILGAYRLLTAMGTLDTVLPVAKG